MNEFKNFESRLALLKQARGQLLSLHKLLVDEERGEFEKKNGQITSGQFLNLLVNDSNFQWLRKFSILIVEIDEMLELDDGGTGDLVENYLLQIANLVNLASVDDEFTHRYKEFIHLSTEVALKHSKLKTLLDL